MNGTKALATAIVELFEDLLDDKGIEVPCADEAEENQRHLNGNTAKLYGTEYGDLIDRVEALLK